MSSKKTSTKSVILILILMVMSVGWLNNVSASSVNPTLSKNQQTPAISQKITYPEYGVAEVLLEEVDGSLVELGSAFTSDANTYRNYLMDSRPSRKMEPIICGPPVSLTTVSLETLLNNASRVPMA